MRISKPAAPRPESNSPSASVRRRRTDGLAYRLFALLVLLSLGILPFPVTVTAGDAPGAVKRRALGPPPDPAARLLEQDAASEYWTLFIELESGHRITQRFLLTNVGPGEHTAVAVGHLVEPGRTPYRYVNGRRRSRWTLSDDRLFMDIGASHLDLHRPTGQLLITKDDIEIRLFFDFAKEDLAAAVPRDRLPPGYAVDFLAVGAKTRGSIQAPWMEKPIETTGRTWMAHTWTEKAEAEVIERRIDIYAGPGESDFYGLQLRNKAGGTHHWFLDENRAEGNIDSIIHAKEVWTDVPRPREESTSTKFPVPLRLNLSGPVSGQITLTHEWLRYDPLTVIPNPFRWFIRRVTEPQEVWADAQIEVTLLAASGAPSLPIPPGAKERKIESSVTRSNSDEGRSSADPSRETEKGSAVRSVTGVASITFMNPVEHR